MDHVVESILASEFRSSHQIEEDRPRDFEAAIPSPYRRIESRVVDAVDHALGQQLVHDRRYWARSRLEDEQRGARLPDVRRDHVVKQSVRIGTIGNLVVDASSL